MADSIRNTSDISSSTSTDKVSTKHLEDMKEKSGSVDTLHNDEALRVLAQPHGEDTWSPEEEK